MTRIAMPHASRALAHRTALAAVLFLAAAAPLRAQNAREVLANLQREFARVTDYRADVTAVVSVPNVSVPPMKAVVSFKQPDKLHIASSGFAMLPRDAVMVNPRMLGEDRYDAVVQGSENVDGTACIKVKLLAKSDTLRLQRAMLYVDPARWVILRMTTDPGQGSSADARFTYEHVENRWYLPSRIQVEMAVSANRRSHAGPGRGDRAGGDRAGGERAGGERAGDAPTRSTVTVTYANYRVNKGISDAVFTESNRNK